MVKSIQQSHKLANCNKVYDDLIIAMLGEWQNE